MKTHLLRRLLPILFVLACIAQAQTAITPILDFSPTQNPIAWEASPTATSLEAFELIPLEFDLFGVIKLTDTAPSPSSTPDLYSKLRLRYEDTIVKRRSSRDIRLWDDVSKRRLSDSRNIAFDIRFSRDAKAVILWETVGERDLAMERLQIGRGFNGAVTMLLMKQVSWDKAFAWLRF